MRNQNCCCMGPLPQSPNLPDTIIYTSVVGQTGPTGPTGATGPTGPAGEATTLVASTNRNDNAQTVTENNMVSITGTNVLSSDTDDLLFVANTVRINATGLYLITTTLELSGDAKTYNFAIRVNDTDYAFVGTINTGANTGTVSHTIYLNIATSPTTVAVYSRTSGSTSISKAELDVVRIV